VLSAVRPAKIVFSGVAGIATTCAALEVEVHCFNVDISLTSFGPVSGGRNPARRRRSAAGQPDVDAAPTISTGLKENQIWHR
jgi:hypothetical protein